MAGSVISRVALGNSRPATPLDRAVVVLPTCVLYAPFVVALVHRWDLSRSPPVSRLARPSARQQLPLPQPSRPPVGQHPVVDDLVALHRANRCSERPSLCPHVCGASAAKRSTPRERSRRRSGRTELLRSRRAASDPALPGAAHRRSWSATPGCRPRPGRRRAPCPALRWLRCRPSALRSGLRTNATRAVASPGRAGVVERVARCLRAGAG